MLLKQRGLTQEELAARIDRSVDAVSNLERGLNLPGFETLASLARALDVPIRDFFDFEDETTAADPIRLELFTTLIEVARRLDTDDLSVALEQVKALAARGQNRRG